ncbi:MAG: ankyrin repeat domain-containing protein [Armatimonadota bacterium]
MIAHGAKLTPDLAFSALDDDMLIFLAEKGMNLHGHNEHGTLLQQATTKKRILFLLRFGVSNKEKDAALRVCPKRMQKYLLDAGANPNVCDRDGRTPLHWAFSYTDVDDPTAASILLAHGANPNLRDNSWGNASA